MLRVAIVALAGASALCACSDPEPGRAPAPPPAETLPPLPRGPRPPLAGEVASAPNPSGLVTMARPLLAVTTARDGIGLALHWEDADTGRIDAAHPLGGKAIDWPGTVDRLRLRVRPVGAEGWTALEPTADEVELAKPPLSGGATLTFSFDGHELRVGPRRRGWKQPAPSLLETPGRYQVQVSGALALEGEPVAFASAPVEVEIAPAGAVAPLAELEQRAAALVARHRKLSPPPLVDRHTVDDVERNRVVRFAPLFGRQPLLIEVVVAPDGGVVAVAEQAIDVSERDSDAWYRLWRRPGAAP